MPRRFYMLGVAASRPEKPKVSAKNLTKVELAALADDMAQLAVQAIQLVSDYRKYVGESQSAEAHALGQRADDLIEQWCK